MSLHSSNTRSFIHYYSGNRKPLGLLGTIKGVVFGGNKFKKHTLTEAICKNRIVEVSLDLDVKHLNFILREIIPSFTSDIEFILAVRMVSMQMPNTITKRGTTRSRNKKLASSSPSSSSSRLFGWLDQVASLLEVFLSHTDDLPGQVVAYAYTYLGLIRQHQEQFSDAIEAFIKALWIRYSAKASDESIAVATHRLGIVYCFAGDYRNGRAALKKALWSYEQAQIPRDHHFVESAWRLWEEFQIKSKSSSSSSSSSRRTAATCSSCRGDGSTSVRTTPLDH